jgi:hypothetical protein
MRYKKTQRYSINQIDLLFETFIAAFCLLEKSLNPGITSSNPLETEEGK